MATDTKSRPEEMLGEINKYDFRNDEHYVFKARKGLDRQDRRGDSEMKSEPAWMREFRLKAWNLQFQAHALVGRADQHGPTCLRLLG